MISLSSVTVQFAGNVLYAGVSFMITKKDRIGLTGRNGAGKTTLLSVISGDLKPETGSVDLQTGTTVGFLRQEGFVDPDRTVYQEAERAFEGMLLLQQRTEEISHELATRTDYESEEYHALLDELAEVGDRMALMGAGSTEADIEKVLRGLGFKHEDLHRPTREFSGGWKMRIVLARLLLESPSCLLLDEPTNHLDIESIRWLERFLQTYDGAVIMVSHDKAFLDNVTNRTIEIDSKKIHDYKAGYSDYLAQRAERRALLEASYRNQQKEIERTEKFIERFRYKASKAVQVQSRVKQLEKLDRIELDVTDNSAMVVRFQDPPRSGKIVATADNVTKTYGDNTVFANKTLHIDRGNRVAFVGKNGEGKSTLAKLLVGKETPTAGEIINGTNVVLGYYAQHQAEELGTDLSVLDVIEHSATGDMRSKVRDILGAFLFSGDEVFKKVRVLSGGEKSRLALAKLLLEPINFLVLDEPTNHLDMTSKDILKAALQEYSGTLIVVSHDRDFLQGLTDRVIEFRNGELIEYAGDVQSFLDARSIDELNELELSEKKRPTPTPVVESAAPTLSWEEQKELQKEKRKLERRVQDIEATIEKSEERIAQLQKQAAKADFYELPDWQEQMNELEQLKKTVAEHMSDWEQTTEELAEVSNKVESKS